MVISFGMVRAGEVWLGLGLLHISLLLCGGMLHESTAATGRPKPGNSVPYTNNNNALHKV